MKTTDLRAIATCILASTLVIAGLRTASAQVTGSSVELVSNLDQPGFGSYPTVFAGQWLAVPFLTGPDAARMESITLHERSWAIHSGSFWVTLYGDNNGSPGSQLPGGSLNGPNMPDGWSFVTYSANSDIVLAPYTRYWVVASSDDPATSGGAYGLGPVASVSYTSNFGWTLFNYNAFTPDGGSTWISTEGFSESRPLFLAVSGVIVPEPSFFLLVSLSLAVLFLLHQSRCRELRPRK